MGLAQQVPSPPNNRNEIQANAERILRLLEGERTCVWIGTTGCGSVPPTTAFSNSRTMASTCVVSVALVQNQGNSICRMESP